MPTSSSDGPVDYAVLHMEMLKLCEADDGGGDFAMEGLLFVLEMAKFVSKAGDHLNIELMGAMSCLRLLKHFHQRGRWQEVLHYGRLMLRGFPPPDGLDESVRDTVLAALTAVQNNVIDAARRSGLLSEALALSDVQMASFDVQAPEQQCSCLGNRALVLQELKKFKAAEPCFQRALEIIRVEEGKAGGLQTDSFKAVARALRLNFQTLQGEREEPLLTPLPESDPSPLRGPLEHFPELFQPSRFSTLEFNARGTQMMSLGRVDQAVKLFLQARDAAERDGEPAEERGIIESNLASAYEQLNDPEKAVAAFQAAIRHHEADPNCWEALAKDHFNLGTFHERRSEADEALECFKHAWDIVRVKPGKPIITVSILRSLGLRRVVQRDFVRAKAAFDRGLEIYEELRPDIADAEGGHRGPLRRYRALLEACLYLAHSQGWHEHGARLIERGKSRFWYESLFKLAGGGSPRSGGVDEETEDLGSEDFGGGRVAILSFLVGFNRTFVAVSFMGMVELHAVDLDEEELRDRVGLFRQQVYQGAVDHGFDSSACRLAEDLLGTASKVFDLADVIVFMPDGPLWSLPFDALPVETEAGHIVPLCRRSPTMLAPSRAVWRTLRAASLAGPKPASMLLVSDPAFGPELLPLPGTRAEAEHILQTLHDIPCKHFEGAAATKARVQGELAHHSLVHLATHADGDLDDDGACLYVGDGKGGTAKITAEEIFAEKIGASLVFLSACSSSIGPESVGEGLMSLSRSFLLAGTQCVAASLWPVGDEETAGLVAEFYEQLARPGASVASALWHVKKSLHDAGASASTWASFQVYGHGLASPLDPGIDERSRKRQI